MRTNEEQAAVDRDRLRRLATEIRALEAEAARAGESTLAYLLDMAALEAESASRC